MNTSTVSSPNLKAWSYLLLLALTWGSSYILIKRGLVAFSPVQLACLRISISALAFLPVFLWRIRRVDWSKLGYLLVVGSAGSAIPAFLFANAQTEISSSLAGLLSTLTPLFTLFLGVLIFRRPFLWTKMLGIILGLVGAGLLIVFGQNSEVSGNSWYGLLVVAGTFFYALSSNTVQSYLQDMSSVTISSVSFVLVGPPALIYLISTDFILVMQQTEGAWKALGYISILSIAGTVMASLFFFKLVQTTDAIFASTVSYLIPIVALGWGLLDGEAITAFHIIGMGLILFGVYVSRNR